VRELELLEIAALHLAQAHPDQAIGVIDGLPESALSAGGSSSESRHRSRRLVAVGASGRHRAIKRHRWTRWSKPGSIGRTAILSVAR
jgi:hypothetical protein